MKRSYIPHIVIAVLLIVFGIGQPLFTVNEREYAIVTELGKPKKVTHEPLHQGYCNMGKPPTDTINKFANLSGKKAS